MAKTELKKGKKKLVKKSAIDSSPKIKKKKLITKKKKQPKKASSSDSESDSDPQTNIQAILEPFPKEQLINLVADLCSSNTTLYSFFESAADADVSHRKLFVHGLGWDATKEAVEEVFSTFGKIEDINVVPDRNTGKCKGYAFITYESRKSANNLLKNPRVTVGNRVVACQLASEGPAAPGAATQKTFASNSNANNATDFHQRKIYVNNVQHNVEPGKLRSFFEKFGEIENGPTGLDPNTGRFRGYAIFVFKTVEGARKVLEEPTKLFDGIQLHCQKAAQGKPKAGNASITTALQPVQPQMLDAATAAHNMALLGQQVGVVNPFYGNLGALMGGYYGMMGHGFGMGGYSGGGAVGGANDGAGGSSGATPQGLQYMYPSSLNGQSSPLPKTSGAGGSGYYPGL